MSDLTRKLRRSSEDFDKAADTAQGTLSAYWRGTAAGLRMAEREVSQEQTIKSIRETWAGDPPPPPSPFPPNRVIREGD